TRSGWSSPPRCKLITPAQPHQDEVRGMAALFSRRRRVATQRHECTASPASAWEALHRAHTQGYRVWPEFVAREKQFRGRARAQVSSPILEIGTTYRTTYRRLPILKAQVTRLEPERVLELEGRLGAWSGTLTLAIEPREGGCTLVATGAVGGVLSALLTSHGGPSALAGVLKYWAYVAEHLDD